MAIISEHPKSDRLLAAMSEDPIDVVALAEAVTRRDCGAVVSFVGVVRDHDEGRAVTRLEYSAHPSANDVLDEVAQDVLQRWELGAVAIAHRVGQLAIGDPAFVVAVSAAHRGEAFDACRWLVDETKARLPVWKHQYFDDGSSQWVNCP